MSKNINFETNKYRGMVNIGTGNILAYSKTAQHYEVVANVDEAVNSFPYTDKDFVIIEAQKVLWQELGNVPIDENECLEEDFYIWSKGTHREEVWEWFDEHYPNGVTGLMFKNVK